MANLRRAFSASMLSQIADLAQIKSATNKLKFAIKMKTSSARTILSGSVIAIPGGCETVLATSSAMLKPTPMNDTTAPRTLISEPTPRNHKAVGWSPASTLTGSRISRPDATSSASPK